MWTFPLSLSIPLTMTLQSTDACADGIGSGTVETAVQRIVCLPALGMAGKPGRRQGERQ
jgi:hypothetical protein